MSPRQKRGRWQRSAPLCAGACTHQSCRSRRQDAPITTRSLWHHRAKAFQVEARQGKRATHVTQCALAAEGIISSTRNTAPRASRNHIIAAKSLWIPEPWLILLAWQSAVSHWAVPQLCLAFPWRPMQRMYLFKSISRLGEHRWTTVAQAIKLEHNGSDSCK